MSDWHERTIAQLRDSLRNVEQEAAHWRHNALTAERTLGNVRAAITNMAKTSDEAVASRNPEVRFVLVRRMLSELVAIVDGKGPGTPS